MVITWYSYMKVARLLCLLLPIQDGQLQLEYFEMVFLEIKSGHMRVLCPVTIVQLIHYICIY